MVENNSKLQGLLETGQIRLPSMGDRVFKDECMYCFDTPFSSNGLFVCLHHFAGTCVKHIHNYFEKTKSIAYLHIKYSKEPLDADAEPEDKIPRLEEKASVIY